MLLFSILALIVISSTASAEGGRIFSRELAEKEGFELTKIESFVDVNMLVMDEITKHKMDPRTFNEDHIMNLLKENLHLPYVPTIVERFQKVIDDTNSNIHPMIGLLEIFTEIAEEENFGREESQNIMVRHEYFERIAERMGVDKDAHKGQSAFGNEGHLKEDVQS